MCFQPDCGQDFILLDKLQIVVACELALIGFSNVSGRSSFYSSRRSLGTSTLTG